MPMSARARKAAKTTLIWTTRDPSEDVKSEMLKAHLHTQMAYNALIS